VAKRFTESTKWKKLWIRKLDPKYKLFWFYLLDNCDHAGIYDADIESASFHIGIEYNKEEILETFNRKIVPFKKDKWFIPKFVEYQYGELNENNRAHLSVINILNKYNLLAPSKELQSILDEAKVKSKGKVKAKSKNSQLEEIKENLEDLQTEFPEVYVKLEYDKFVDYLAANGKTYKNYKSGFKNWLRNDSFGQIKREGGKIKEKIYLACPAGHHKREVDSRGIRGVCPECRVSMIPLDKLQLERTLNG